MNAHPNFLNLRWIFFTNKHRPEIQVHPLYCAAGSKLAFFQCRELGSTMSVGFLLVVCPFVTYALRLEEAVLDILQDADPCAFTAAPNLGATPTRVMVQTCPDPPGSPWFTQDSTHPECNIEVQHVRSSMTLAATCCNSPCRCWNLRSYDSLMCLMLRAFGLSCQGFLMFGHHSERHSFWRHGRVLYHNLRSNPEKFDVNSLSFKDLVDSL